MYQPSTSILGRVSAAGRSWKPFVVCTFIDDARLVNRHDLKNATISLLIDEIHIVNHHKHSSLNTFWYSHLPTCVTDYIKIKTCCAAGVERQNEDFKLFLTLTKFSNIQISYHVWESWFHLKIWNWFNFVVWQMKNFQI